ncbi:unnamed protein product [marine sediment metagenome]|uniref:MEDS domain-containing protein n=1 Tax=marine sediment metagenome TaxID=412755 RepID=X1PLB4_9ZZZZ
MNISTKLKTRIKDLKLGEHICSIYKNEKEKFSIIVPFVISGFKNSEKCIYIIDENKKNNIIVYFKKKKINIFKYIKSDQLEFLTKEDSYLKDGYFDIDKMIDLLKLNEKVALRSGCSGFKDCRRDDVDF